MDEWINSTLKDVLVAYPEYEQYSLYVWDNEDLWDLGPVSDNFFKYKNNLVFGSSEEDEAIYLEGSIDNLQVRDMEEV